MSKTTGDEQIKIKPFDDESSSVDIDGLTIENRLDRVSFYGDIAITADRVGYDKALKLKNFLSSVINHLEWLDRVKKLPDNVIVDQPVAVKNPFE